MAEVPLPSDIPSLYQPCVLSEVGKDFFMKVVVALFLVVGKWIQTRGPILYKTG